MGWVWFLNFAKPQGAAGATSHRIVHQITRRLAASDSAVTRRRGADPGGGRELTCAGLASRPSQAESKRRNAHERAGAYSGRGNIQWTYLVSASYIIKETAITMAHEDLI